MYEPACQWINYQIAFDPASHAIAGAFLALLAAVFVAMIGLALPSDPPRWHR